MARTANEGTIRPIPPSFRRQVTRAQPDIVVGVCCGVSRRVTILLRMGEQGRQRGWRVVAWMSRGINEDEMNARGSRNRTGEALVQTVGGGGGWMDR